MCVCVSLSLSSVSPIDDHFPLLAFFATTNAMMMKMRRIESNNNSFFVRSKCACSSSFLSFFAFFCFFGPFFRLFCPFCPSVVPTHKKKRERETHETPDKKEKGAAPYFFSIHARDFEKKNTKSVVSRAPLSKLIETFSKLVSHVVYFFVAQRVVVINKRRNKRHISSKRVVFAVDTCAASTLFCRRRRTRRRKNTPTATRKRRTRVVDAATFFERSSDEKGCALFFRGVGLVFKKAVIADGNDDERVDAWKPLEVGHARRRGRRARERYRSGTLVCRRGGERQRV